MVPGASPHQRPVYSSFPRESSPCGTASGHRSLKHQHRHGEDASAHPVGSKTQNDYIEERDEHDPGRAGYEHGRTQRGQSMQHPGGHGAESENQYSARHHDFGGPAGPSSLHGQRTQHRSETETTEQQPITQWTLVDRVGHGRQQRQKRAGEETCLLTTEATRCGRPANSAHSRSLRRWHRPKSRPATTVCAGGASSGR